jgi:hypothetical protein
VSHLRDEVSGNIRNVFINQLNRNNALILSALLYVEFITIWVVVLLPMDTHSLAGMFIFTLLILMLGAGVWLLVTAVALRREPQKTKVVEFPYRKLMHMALLGWLGLSAFLFIINLLTPSSVWFQWPVIGIANWPLNIWLYHRQLAGGRYDA